MKKTVLLVLSALLVSCYTLQDVKQPRNKTTHDLNIGYQEAYRLINTSLIQVCGTPAEMLHPIIYADVGYATITSSFGMEVEWSMDLKDAGQSKTTMEFYSPYAPHQLSAQRIKEHINKKVSGCVISPLQQ